MQFDLAQKWDNSHVRIPKDKIQSRYAEQVASEFFSGSIICDLGGGSGADAIYFLSKGHSVILIDISEYTLQVAKRKAEVNGYTLNIRQTDLGEKPLPVESDSVDVVYSRLGLHYFNSTTTSEIFKEIMRILKKGGKAFIVVKSPADKKEMDFLKSTATELEEGMFQDGDIIKSRFSEEQWRAILINSGITSFEIRPYTEEVQDRNDAIKSGSTEFLLTEIRIIK